MEKGGERIRVVVGDPQHTSLNSLRQLQQAAEFKEHSRAQTLSSFVTHGISCMIQLLCGCVCVGACMYVCVREREHITPSVL